MRVLFITPWFPTEENPVSGVFVKELAKAAALHDQVAVLYGRAEDEIKEGIYHISRETEEGIEIFRVSCRKLPMLSNLLYLYSMFRAFQRVKKSFNPEVIHAHTYTGGFIGVICGRAYKIPVIVTCHTMISDEIKFTRKKIVRAAKRLIARFTLNHAQILLPASKRICEDVRLIGVKRECDGVLPNIVNTELFHPSNRDECDKKRVKNILFVGGLYPVKGVHHLLKALSLLVRKRSDFHLDIVGYGAYEEECKRLAVSLGLYDKVTFHGRKRKEEVAEFMRNCDFLVFPSLVVPDVHEGFGIVLVEAIACGKPVVTTSNCESITYEEYGVLVPVGDIPALAEAIDYMLDHFQEYPSEGFVEYVRSSLNHEAVGRRLHEIYVRAAEKFNRKGEHQGCCPGSSARQSG